MDIWLIVAVVVAVAVVVLLVVLTLRRRSRRSVGPDAETPAPAVVDAPPETGPAEDHSDPAGPLADGTTDRPAEDLPTEPVSTSSAGAPADPEPDLRTERLPVRREAVNAADTAAVTHVLPVVERAAPAGDRAEPNRHVRPDGDRSPAPVTSTNGGGRHRAPTEANVPAPPQPVLADHQRTEPHGRPAIPPARTPEPPPNPATVPPPAAGPSPVAGPPPVVPPGSPSWPGSVGGPPLLPNQVPAPRAPALAGSELFSESTSPPDNDSDPDDGGQRSPSRTLADRLLGRNR